MKQEHVTEQFYLKQLKLARNQQSLNGIMGGGVNSYLFTTILITIY